MITFVQSIITVFKGGSNSTRAPIQLAGIAKRVTTGTKMTQSATDIVILDGQVQLHCASYHVGTLYLRKFPQGHQSPDTPSRGIHKVLVVSHVTPFLTAFSSSPF
jgi:hypothetical protein